ncbi:MAG: response regulator transcription factor [Caldilinea sp.]|nr:response regulator transcription factor [Caldilinea sp.]MDW8439293.1 response regulator transcription factor [Caldilineaceae bacterium]
MSRWRLLLADDHELFRAGLAGLINSQPDLEVAGQAGDGFEALKLARELRPALIVMDISMPICDGLEATRLIRATPELATTPILMLTVHEEDEKLFEAVKAGANGYMLKSSNAAEFLRGVRAALNGEAILPSRLAARLMGEFARLAAQVDAVAAAAGGVAAEEELTWREREVLGWLATGASDSEIAERLTLSVHTVKTHVRHILAKLHAVNRRAAVSEAKRRGWLPSSPSTN